LTARRSQHAVGAFAVVFAIVITLGVSCNGFREDEIECEQAVVHLRECCPGFRASAVSCTYSDHVDCSDNLTSREYPALNLEESECLQRKSCADLVSTGACTRAQEAKPVIIEVDGGGRPIPSSVCTP